MIWLAKFMSTIPNGELPNNSENDILQLGY